MWLRTNFQVFVAYKDFPTKYALRAVGAAKVYGMIPLLEKWLVRERVQQHTATKLAVKITKYTPEQTYTHTHAHILAVRNYTVS